MSSFSQQRVLAEALGRADGGGSAQGGGNNRPDSQVLLEDQGMGIDSGAYSPSASSKPVSLTSEQIENDWESGWHIC